jgi:hypothetical protein
MDAFGKNDIITTLFVKSNKRILTLRCSGKVVTNHNGKIAEETYLLGL